MPEHEELPPSSNRRSFGIGRAILALLLVGAVVVNVAGFDSADREARTFWRAIHRYDVSSFAELSVTEDPYLRGMYSMYRALAEIAPGSTVHMPRRRPEIALRLYGAGDVRLVRTGGPSKLPRDVDVAPFVVASSEGVAGSKDGPWAIALDEPDPRPANMRDPSTFFPAILTAGRRGTARGEPRELALVKWVDPTIAPGFKYRLLLIETSLIAPPANKESPR